MSVKIHLDILISIFGKSGVENAVNKIAPYLQQNGFCVRIVSLMWKGKGDVPQTVGFYPLSDGSEDFPFDHFEENYTKFLLEKGAPDMILATGKPILTYISRLSVQKLNCKNCKIISWPHQSIDVYVSDGYGGLECFKLSDAVFALNKKTCNLVHAYDSAICVKLVKNPVDFTQCPLHNRTGWQEKTLLFVGRLAPQKRLDIILQAVSRTRDRWKLVIVGDGEERDDLPELIELLHLEDQVILTGWQANPWEFIGDVAALVMASDFECLPLTALESLASGIPVISTPADGITEIIKPGVNGFLFPFEDIDGLAKILDAISDGLLPEISSEACRESVMDFEESKVLHDFREKLLEVWNDPIRKIFSHKPNTERPHT